MIWFTGITGDLGKQLSKSLQQKGFKVHPSPRVDVTDFQAVLHQFRRQLERDGPPASVFHCAVFVELGKTEADPARTCAVNELGAINALKALQELGLSPWTCMVNTGHFYSPLPKPARLVESSPLNPRSAYALSKMNAENWAMLFSERAKIPVFSPRIFSFTAPWQRQSFVVPRLAKSIKSALMGQEVTTGWLGAYRDFLDIRDVSEALCLAMQKNLAGIFNVCSGEAVQIRSIIDFFCLLKSSEQKHAISVKLKEGAPRPDDVEWLIGDPSKFQKATGFKPELPWEQTLRDVWAAVD